MKVTDAERALMDLKEAVDKHCQESFVGDSWLQSLIDKAVRLAREEGKHEGFMEVIFSKSESHHLTHLRKAKREGIEAAKNAIRECNPPFTRRDMEVVLDRLLEKPDA